jgi:hypothetical protein
MASPATTAVVMSRTTIAERIGVNPRTVAEMIRKLRKKGIIVSLGFNGRVEDRCISPGISRYPERSLKLIAATQSVEVFGGPQCAVPSSEIYPAGFDCHDCHKPVRFFKVSVPESVSRRVYYICDCGAISSLGRRIVSTDRSDLAIS